MGYSPSWKANSSFANQQTLHILSNPKVHHVCNSLPHIPVLSQISPIYICHPVSWRCVLMLFTLLCLGLLNGLSVQVSRAKAIHNSFPHTCYIPHLSSFVWFLKQYFLKSRHYEPAHNIGFFIPLLPFPFSPWYHSQHPNLKHPKPVFQPPCEKPAFTRV